MNAQPVIRRELLSASRRRETWRLRLVFGGGALAAALFGLLLPHVPPTERGPVVLLCMAICGFAMSVFAGAYVTADAVCSEKREGTLGLLFLTPLNGWEIVLGKMFTHSLQVKYAVLGGFPLLFLPVLLGGVLWVEVTRILLALLLTLLLSLGCGVFWSTAAREARTAVLATAVSMLVLTLLPWLWVMVQAMTAGGIRLAGVPQLSPMTTLVTAFESNYRMYWSAGPKGPGAAAGASVYWGAIACSLGLTVILLGVAGWLLPWLWRRLEAGSPLPSRTSVDLHLRRSLPGWAPPLDAAPILWLAARQSADAHWINWVRRAIALVFAVSLVVAVTTRYWESGFIFAFCAAYVLHLITRLELALTSTRRLHEDWRTGALEVVLTTTVPTAKVVDAHHHSVAHIFRARLRLLLAMNGLLEAAVIMFHDRLRMGGGADLIFSVFFVGGAVVTVPEFVALRWLGLRESLRNSTQLKAAGRSFARLVMVPWPAFALVFLLATGTGRSSIAAMLFSTWFVACLLYDHFLVRACRHWLKAGLRHRASEGS